MDLWRTGSSYFLTKNTWSSKWFSRVHFKMWQWKANKKQQTNPSNRIKNGRFTTSQANHKACLNHLAEPGHAPFGWWTPHRDAEHMSPNGWGNNILYCQGPYLSILRTSEWHIALPHLYKVVHGAGHTVFWKEASGPVSANENWPKSGSFERVASIWCLWWSVSVRVAMRSLKISSPSTCLKWSHWSPQHQPRAKNLVA